MGKGDRKTRKGKIFNSSFGKKRPRKKELHENKIQGDEPKLVSTFIFNKKTGETLISFRGEDIIKPVDPVKYYKDNFIVKQMIMRGIPKEELNGKTKPSDKNMEIFIEANQLWNKQYTQIKKTPIPENLIKLLSTTKKADQEKLLKGVELTPDLIAALIFEASEKHGYRMSQYRTDIPQKGIDESDLPKAFMEQEDGTVKKFGKSDLSDGQLKQAIQHRRVTIGKFLERGDVWHCFFTNYKSLRGEEKWLGKKQPHYHYVSSGFGLEKKKVIKELRSENYNIKNFHVALKGYGNQPE
ncbi:30S ribosomal protein THX [Flagellimonas sediminis]|uniref:30S ribosomal protein THX n=1 Tax=Flagellimonas sediminis TaxID=2696468 RepID=A0A6I5L017_9FLAO|nr:30S ribosomal protein THX [Allomuricauda sediminis]NDV43111.1 30S ribosomal protein THX [Allomuricauda sediminis]